MTSPATSSGRGLAEHLIPRTRFGKYTLIAKIGHGGMAEVFLAALDGPAGFTKLTVLKRLHPHLEDEPQLIGMFLDEARLAARLNHPHVVQTYEVGDVDGRHFLAMEYLEGQSFARLLKYATRQGETIPMAVAVRIFIDALDGLDYAHTLTDFDGTPLRVVHRDISPGNIFLTYSGQVKVLDFGIAKAGTQMMETRAGQVKGKFAYIAPEQARPGAHDHRADIWSMGVVFWEAFAGRRLFKGETEITTLQNALNAEVPRLDTVVDVPTAVADIAERALQRDPLKRFESAEEMKEALESLMIELGWRVSRSDVGKCVAGYFENERVEQRKVLETFMAGAPAEAVQAVTASTAPEAASGITGVRPTHSGLEGNKKKKGGLNMKAVAAVLLGAAVIGALAAVVVPKLMTDESEPETLLGTGAEGVDEPASGSTSMNGAGAEAPTGAEAAEAAIPAVEPTTMEPSQEPTDEPDVAEPSDVPQGVVPNRRPRMRVWMQMARMAPVMQTMTETMTEPVAEMVTEMAAVEYGTLTFDTRPWSRVSLRGRSLGTTPLINERLPAGRHTLTLTNPERGIRTTSTVTIRAGERTTRRIGIE